MPRPGSRLAIHAELVSTIWPKRISVPIERISAFIRRAPLCAEVKLALMIARSVRAGQAALTLALSPRERDLCVASGSRRPHSGVPDLSETSNASPSLQLSPARGERAFILPLELLLLQDDDRESG